MKQRIEIITEFLTEQMNHWMLFPLAMTVMGLASEYTGCQKPDFGMWILTGAFPFLFFWFRKSLRHFLSFLGAHAAIAVLALVIPASDTCSRILCILCTAAYLVYSFHLRLKIGTPYTSPVHPAAATALSAAAVILLHYQGKTSWDSYYIFLLIGVFALYFVIYYMMHYLRFLALNQSSTGYLPAEEMFHSGIELVLGYTFLGALVMLLCSDAVWPEKLAAALKKALFAILRAFFSLFHATEGEQQITPTRVSPPMTGDAVPLPASEEPFWFWKVLEVLFIVILICGLIYGCIRLLTALVRFIRERFAHGLLGEKTEKKTEHGLDVREKCDLTKESRDRAEGPLAFLSPRARIRKIYRKKLLSSHLSSRFNLGMLTARESERQLQLEGMADIYEQARYSDRKLTAEDVRNMKNACK